MYAVERLLDAGCASWTSPVGCVYSRKGKIIRIVQPVAFWLSGVGAYKTKLKLDKEVGGGGGSARERENRTRELEEPDHGPSRRPALEAPQPQTGGDQRENERTAREDGRNQRATLHDVWPLRCLSPRPTLGPTIDLVWKTETLAISEREMHS